jgi:hypothetical protein
MELGDAEDRVRGLELCEGILQFIIAGGGHGGRGQDANAELGIKLL